MNGIDALTGAPLSGLAHVAQSIRDILTTPLGSRVMRPEYGSRLPALVDAPANQATFLDWYVATAEALRRWEPRVKLRRVQAVEVGQGSVALELDLDYLGEPVSLTVTA